jgi:hypothetical protein
MGELYLGATLKEIMFSAFNNYFGPGSEPEQTVQFIEQFPEIVKGYEIKSVADAGCGRGWIRRECEKIDVSYSGFDINERPGAEVFDIIKRVKVNIYWLLPVMK